MLVVDTQGAVVRRSDGLLEVEKPDGVARQLRARSVESVVIFGNVRMTPAALSLLMNIGAPVVFATRAGKVKGTLAPEQDGTASIRLAQWRLVLKKRTRLEVARRIVRSKIDSQRVFARKARRTAGTQDAPDTGRQLGRLRQKADGAADLPELRGIEGYATRLHYESVAARLPSWGGFNGRKYHPSPDPANALMSLSYAVLRPELNVYVAAFGLDPYVGFLHEANERRPGLLYDLLEPFRAPLDGFVCTVLNRRQFRPEHFEATNTGAVLLTDDARRSFFRCLLEWMGPRKKPEETDEGTLRWRCHRFCREISSCIRVGDGGEP